MERTIKIQAQKSLIGRIIPMDSKLFDLIHSKAIDLLNQNAKNNEVFGVVANPFRILKRGKRGFVTEAAGQVDIYEGNTSYMKNFYLRIEVEFV